jgi:NAD(P)H dehydrogenase (quinone)
LDRFDRLQQHPQPAQPRFSGESVVWRNEHAASADDRFGVIEISPASVSPSHVWGQRLSS